MQKIIICILVVFNSCSGQTVDKSMHAEGAQVEALKEYYEKAMNTKGEEKTKYEQLFFKAFPSSFSQFISLYGAKDVGDSSDYMPLFHCCYNHIELFNSLQSIEKREYYSKYISIAIGGKWDSDHVAGLQSGLNEKAMMETKTFVELLKLRQENEIKGFWHFFYDGNHPDDPQVQARYQKMYGKLEKFNPSMALLMKREYQNLLKESDKHGN